MKGPCVAGARFLPCCTPHTLPTTLQIGSLFTFPQITLLSVSSVSCWDLGCYCNVTWNALLCSHGLSMCSALETWLKSQLCGPQNVRAD